MKKISLILFLLCTLAACQMGTVKSSEADKKTERPEMITGARCSFDLPEDLFLVAIDTSQFSPDGYYKIHSHVSENTLQIFVFDALVNEVEKVSNQVSHINSPDVFTAAKTDSLNTFGKYNGTGVMMTGLYEGGVVNGRIRIFSGNGDKRGFLVIRQHVAGNDKDKAAFELLEKSFLLK